MISRSLLTLLAATALSSAVAVPAVFTPAAAQISLNINLGPPPQPQYEAVPDPRPGHVWAPGYWQSDNNRYAWVPGRWMEERRGQRWVSDRWESERDGDREKWHHRPGRWDRDDGNDRDRRR